MSLVGKFLYNFERKICYNLRKFIGKHERTIEILFLILFFSLQGLLAFYVFNPIVTLVVIIFLFFLALERIFVHIWLDYEREQLKLTEDKLRENYRKLRTLAYQEVFKLHKEVNQLKDKLRRS